MVDADDENLIAVGKWNSDLSFLWNEPYSLSHSLILPRDSSFFILHSSICISGRPTCRDEQVIYSRDGEACILSLLGYPDTARRLEK